tara:strand:- start:196 stop:435 length:240 start_codon:yes stop_codon:yes gene_type:complete
VLPTLFIDVAQIETEAVHTRISSLDPTATVKKRWKSAGAWLCLPNPSTILAQMDLLARRTRSAIALCFPSGKLRLALWT